MKLIAVTQRVDVIAAYGERRDALDQRWQPFLAECGLLPVLCPNHPGNLQALLQTLPVAGALLTSGNTLSAYGGDAPERDSSEQLVFETCLRRGLPVLGVCRGMQFIQHHYGVKLEAVTGHVAREQEITIDGRPARVNSYHDWGATGTVPELEVWAVAADGVVKAVRHRSRPVTGIMWHPERLPAFRSEDKALFRDVFAGSRQHA